MARWLDGYMASCLDGWKLDGWKLDGWLDGRRDGRLVGCLDG